MTRKLTETEIEDILDFIKPQQGIPLETALSVVTITKQRFRKQLEHQMIYPETDYCRLVSYVKIYF